MELLLDLMEFVLTLGLDFADTPGVSRQTRCIITVLVWVCTIICAGLCVLCGVCAVSYFRQGDYKAVAGLTGTAVVLLLGIYLFCLRHYIKRFRAKK